MVQLNYSLTTNHSLDLRSLATNGTQEPLTSKKWSM